MLNTLEDLQSIFVPFLVQTACNNRIVKKEQEEYFLWISWSFCKSICMMIYNLAVEENYRIGIFSLEMNSDGFAKRVLHKKSEERENYDYVKELSEASKNRIWIDDTPGISVSAIKSKCLEMKEKQGGLDYVFIDYFQLLSADKEYERWEEKEAVISRGLKDLAKELECAIVVTAQLSRRIDEKSLEERPNKSRRPTWSDFRETVLEQDTDAAVLLYRGGKYNPDSPYKGKVDAIIRKNRNSPEGISFFFYTETAL